MNGQADPQSEKHLETIEKVRWYLSYHRITIRDIESEVEILFDSIQSILTVDMSYVMLLQNLFKDFSLLIQILEVYTNYTEMETN